MNPSLGRRTFLRGAAAAVAAASASFAAAPAQASGGRTPNFVIILADDLGYGAIEPYGQQYLLTPNLTRMAEEGIAFTDCYSGAPICAPSRCSLLTGMHTGHSRVRDNSFTQTGEEPELLPEDVTFAQVLHAAGYRTGVFGKWGFGPDDAYVPLGVGTGCDNESPDAGGPAGDLTANVGHPSHPLQKGFDEFLGMVRHHHATEGYWPNYLWHGNERVLLPENQGEAKATYAPEEYVRRALDFMARNRHRPFCVYLTPQLVHWPNHVPDTSPYDDMPWTEEQKRYAAQHTKLDSYVGAVMDQLTALGIADNTLVLFTSDNGPTVERAAAGSQECAEQLGPSPDAGAADQLWDTNGGLRAEKHSLYEGGIRVPMVVWGPGIVGADPQAVAGESWFFPDVLPTLADLAGVTPPSDVDGTSVRGWITGECDRVVDHPPLYWERPPYGGINVDGSPPASTSYGQAARDGRWKALRYTPGADPAAPDDQWLFELYDLEADRGEQLNLAALNPDRRRHFESVMKAAHAPKPYTRAPYRPRPTGDAWHGVRC